jgi:histidine ammonia-lyase
MTDRVTFSGDALSLSDWRRLARGGTLSLSPEVFAKVDRAAATVAAIVAKGEAVYGINTGFGKLANVRIEDRDI